MSITTYFAMRRWLKQSSLYGLSPSEQTEGLQARRGSFTAFYYFTIVLELLLLLPGTVFWFLMFRGGARFLAPEMSGWKGQLIEPSGAYWAVLALVTAILANRLVPIVLACLLFKDRRAYFAYYHWKRGFKEYRAYRHGSAVFASLILFGFFVGSGTFTAFLEDRIVIQRPFDLPRVFGYDAVREIRAIEDFEKGYYWIRFSDGYGWHTGSGLRVSEPHCDWPKIALVQKRSGVRIQGPDLRTASEPGLFC